MNAVPRDTETIAACLTPPGVAAIATVALRGSRAWDFVRPLFHLPTRELPSKPEPGAIWLGRLGEEIADQVVLTVKQFEPLPWLELHCHGGREVVRYLLDLLQTRGVTICSWQHFTGQVTQNRLQAEAAIGLARARTARTAAILLDQYQGAFERAVTAARAALDRGDEVETDRLVKELCRWSQVGRHLVDPWRVVLAGAPNVGKSSLLNALAGYQRCVVAPTPGTTRDVVTAFLAIDGWPVELSDTAGQRAAEESLEGQGIDRARTAAAGADLCLWVLDAAEAPLWPALGGEKGARHLLPERPEGCFAQKVPDPFFAAASSFRLVVNKIDLPPAWDLDQAAGAVRVSARSGAGIDLLCDTLAAWLVPEVPPAGSAVPFTSYLCDQVEDVRRLWTAGRAKETRQVLEEMSGGGRATVDRVPGAR